MCGGYSLQTHLTSTCPGPGGHTDTKPAIWASLRPSRLMPERSQAAEKGGGPVSTGQPPTRQLRDGP